MPLGKLINALVQGQWLRQLAFSLFFLLTFSANTYAGGLTVQQAIDSTAANPTCNAGVCNTPAKVMWSAYDVAGFPENTAAYFTSPTEAMINYSSASYGSFYGFCQRLGGTYVGLRVADPNLVINNTFYSSYNGNCGATNYENPDYRGYIPTYAFCPSGYAIFVDFYYHAGFTLHTTDNSPNYPGCYATYIKPVSPKTPASPKAPPIGKSPSGCGFAGNPIELSLGTKSQTETDYAWDGLNLSRTYVSSGVVGASKLIGANWYFDFNNKLLRNSPTEITAARANGAYFNFKLVNNVWLADADIADRLIQTVDAGGNLNGWNYIDATSNATENYDVNGLLSSLITQTGRTTYYSYITTVTTGSINNGISLTNTTEMIKTVSNDLGQQLVFTYNTGSNTISKIQLPDGGQLAYTYDTSNNLSSVTYPDAKVKTYHYGSEVAEAAYVSATPVAGISYTNALTGITDENNSRFATWNYDNVGRAISSEHADAAEKVSLSYTADANGNPTSTVVTDSRGSPRTYNFTTILGVVKSTGQSQPAGSGCAASAAALTYDVNGNVASRTDFKGNKTTYVYDLARNLETSRTEGLTSAGATTAATRTVATTYHPTWRLPLVTAEYTGATTTGTALRSTTNVYDVKGNIISIIEADPVRSTSRTTTVTYTYSTLVSGLVVTKAIDGPRSDVSDVTIYNYYDANVTCTPSAATPLIDPITNTSPSNLGCRGQLQSMTDALGHTMTYDRYNHHGQVEQMTDANGLVTTNTYDLRQRLLSRNVSGSGIVTQTTSLTYDGVGQVTQLTLPDSSSLNYSYDAAHRLTQVQDNLGNKMTSTLDSEGNRINETTNDPLGTLTKTLTRRYDALNRLQQVIGVQ